MDKSRPTPYRAQAEQKWQERIAKYGRPRGDIEQLIHELEVHQIELEMQNEELRRTQAQLEESRRRYADLYDFAPVGYFGFDRNGVIHDVNLTGADLVGVPRGRLLNKPFSVCLHRDDVPLFLRHLRTVWDLDVRDSVEIRLKGGRYILLESLVLETARGRNCRTSAMDVTDWRAAEREAQASRRQLALLFDNVTDYAIFMLDTNGVITDWNAGAQRILGFDRVDAIGASGEIIFTPEDCEADVAARELAAARQEVVSDERWYLRKDGSRLCASSVLTALRDEHNIVVGFARILRDHTARRAAEEERERLLRQREEERAQLEVVLQQLPAGVVIVDREARVRLCNAQAEALVGQALVQTELATCATSLRLYTADDRRYAPADWPVMRALRGERVVSEEVQYRRDDGRYAAWIVSAAPIYDRDGTVTGAAAAFYDVTEGRMRQAEKTKANTLESVGTLAGGIAHDFNNVLTAIVGNLYLVKLGLDPGSELQQVIAEAEQACVRASVLTHHLLTFAKGGAPVKRRVATTSWLRGVFAAAARGLSVDYRAEVPDDLWPLEIDAAQIEQAIDSLVTNAEQAMPDGGLIELAAANVRSPYEDVAVAPRAYYVRITVDDDGIGIPPAQISKVFDPFFSTKPKSIGLGLTIAYSIVQRHGGHIAATPRSGGGTRFAVYLPAAHELR